MRVIFWGGTGQALVVRDIIGQWAYNELVAVFDDTPNLPPPFADVPLYPGALFDQWIDHHEVHQGLATIGGAHGAARVRIHQRMREKGLHIPKAVHKTAHLSPSAVIGEGAQILPHATIMAKAFLGDSVIVNTAASVDHECVLGAGVHIAPGATLAGCVYVGPCTFIGAGAVILPRVTIGADCIIGAGAVVTKDVPNGTVVKGVPAR